MWEGRDEDGTREKRLAVDDEGGEGKKWRKMDYGLPWKRTDEDR